MRIATSFLVTAVTASTASAFAPSLFQTTSISSSSALNAVETLEGWKYDGVLKPANNFILVKNVPDQEETDSGILLSKTVCSSKKVIFDKTKNG